MKKILSLPQELLESWDTLSRDEYDVASIINLTFNDLDELVNFLKETRNSNHKRMIS